MGNHGRIAEVYGLVSCDLSRFIDWTIAWFIEKLIKELIDKSMNGTLW
jgi:hypothetical protein